MKYFFLLIGFTIVHFVSAQKLSTTFTKDLSRWTWDGYNIVTLFSGNNDNWSFEGTSVKTVFRNNFEQWRLGDDVQIKTIFSKDFGSWMITGYNKTIYVKATFSNDFERWQVSGDASGSISTIFSKNFESWNIQLDGIEEEELQMAVVFIPVIIALNKGVN